MLRFDCERLWLRRINQLLDCFQTHIAPRLARTAATQAGRAGGRVLRCVARKLAQTHESAHDGDIDLNRASAIQYAG